MEEETEEETEEESEEETEEDEEEIYMPPRRQTILQQRWSNTNDISATKKENIKDEHNEIKNRLKARIQALRNRNRP